VLNAHAEHAAVAYTKKAWSIKLHKSPHLVLDAYAEHVAVANTSRGMAMSTHRMRACTCIWPSCE